mmetsp:Transcript_6354/g.16336  ORF Transcript_6354/g.16336 Transcript_6354/m.16336 type:complete len:377 (-) Transcript_6354:61-1191(-)
MADPEGDPWILSGFITKRGESRKNWKRRFMVLHHSGVLRYFKAPFEEGKKMPKPCGQIHVTDCVDVVEIDRCDCEWPMSATSGNAFGLATTSRIFFLVCETDAESVQWQRNIKSRLPHSSAAAAAARPTSMWRPAADDDDAANAIVTSGSVYEVVNRPQAALPQSTHQPDRPPQIQYVTHVPQGKPNQRPAAIGPSQDLYTVPVRVPAPTSESTVYTVVKPRARAPAPLPDAAARGAARDRGQSTGESVVYSSVHFSDDDSDDGAAATAAPPVAPYVPTRAAAAVGGDKAAGQYVIRAPGRVPKGPPRAAQPPPAAPACKNVYQNVVIGKAGIKIKPQAQPRVHPRSGAEAQPPVKNHRYVNVVLPPQVPSKSHPG